MSESEYYENEEYQDFLLSSRRKEILPPELIFEHFKFTGITNLVDFGAGKGFFIPEFRKILPVDSWIWAAEYQQDLLDILLKRKIDENISNFTPFFIEKSDHPLLPEWIPTPDLIFSCLCLSTFPDPGLAMDGLIRSMDPRGRLIVVDWNKHEYNVGPKVSEKISIDKMIFLAEDYNLKVVKQVRVKELFYALEITAGPNFVYGYYDLKEEDSETGIWNTG